MKVRRTWIGVAGIVVALGVTIATPSAQRRKPMTLLDIAELPRIIDPQLSPDGQYLIYMLSHADWKADRAVWHLWKQDTQGRSPLQLTSGGNGDVPGTARWSPDGSSILFVRDGQIAVVPAAGGEPRQLTRHATGVSSPAWSPDGRFIYFLAFDPRATEERDRDRLRGDVYAVDENYTQRHLWNFVVASGTRIALQRAPTPLVDDTHRGEVWVMDANGENGRPITRNDVEEGQPELSPDNSQVLFIAETNDKFEPYYNPNVFVMPASGGGATLLMPDFPYAIDQASWSPDGRSIFAVVNMGVHSEIFQIDVASRKATQLTDGQHYIPPTWSLVPPAGKMVFQFDEPARFGDAWTLSIPASGAGSPPPPPTRVTRVYDDLDRDFALPRQEKVEWLGADGAKVEGLLFYPIDYVAGKSYPLVVQMHGGPMESDKFGAGPGLLLNYFPVLAAKGYAVLRPNYRGSAGYGNASYRDVVGGYFKNMDLDVLAGVDSLIKRGIVDPDRLALMGWSAGGHLTNRLITVSHRFAAASSGAGASDWTSMFSLTDMRANRTIWFGGTPWQKDPPMATFWNNSPLNGSANVTTPTLFFAGENDRRVPPEQAMEMYRAIKSHLVPTHLYIAPREGHQWVELRHQIFKANAELAWFDRYLLARTYTPEKAPGDGASAP